MDSELEVIHNQMEETRASLADKLETLEAQVRDTVQSASEAVSTTVENVKETVSTTVENVKETVESVTESVESVATKLDPRPYFEEHPWTALGAAVGVGFVGGLLAGGSSSSSAGEGQKTWAASSTPPPPPAPAPTSASYSAPQESRGPGLLGSLMSPGGIMGEVATKLTGLAVGTLMGYLREMVSSSAPNMWKNDLTGLLDNITTQLGGKVIHHPDLAREGQEEHSSCGQIHGSAAQSGHRGM